MRVAVIGCGPMGLNHARAVKRLSGVTLAGVVDTHPERATAAARELDCAVLEADLLSGQIDAVVVATPPATHAAVALPLLKAGIHCLVEKPLALTDADVAAFVAVTSAEPPVVVRVGQVERFNPAVRAFASLHVGRIEAMTALRFNAPGRAIALDVISDLMVHDLDLALHLKGDAATCIEARRIGPEQAEAQIQFADGARAAFAVDRAAPTTIRSLTIAADNRPYHLNLVTRQLTPTAKSPTSGDQLEAELSDFLAAIRGARGIGATVAEAAAVHRLVADIRGKIGS